METEKVWWRVTLPAFVSTAGYTEVLSCVECGATVTITANDASAGEIHIRWHGEQGK